MSFLVIGFILFLLTYKGLEDGYHDGREGSEEVLTYFMINESTSHKTVFLRACS